MPSPPGGVYQRSTKENWGVCVHNLQAVDIDTFPNALTKHNPSLVNIVKLQTAGISRQRNMDVHCVMLHCVALCCVVLCCVVLCCVVLSLDNVVISLDIDILALTETWLGIVIDDHVINALVPR